MFKNSVAKSSSERENRITVNGLESTWKNIISDKPQGSVLGPVLFLVFTDVINVLNKVVRR